TLQDLEVTDVLFPGWNETVATLAPDSAKVYTLDYLVTQADLGSGKLVNAVALTGDDANWDPLTHGQAGVEVPAVQSPAITVTKSTDRSKTYSAEGEVIEYTIIVTNTGNVTLTNVQVTDDNADVTNVGTISELEVGQSETFTASHTITQADLDAGVVYNVATATGKDPKDRDVTGKSTDNNPLDPTDPDSPDPDPNCPECTIVPIDQDGAITVTKSTDRSKTYSAEGEV